ncbi:MAG: PAS domain S-box protein [Desulfuromonas sp.]|nr:PAS domain S-box protein [Desulfuromonas sp.]
MHQPALLWKTFRSLFAFPTARQVTLSLWLFLALLPLRLNAATSTKDNGQSLPSPKINLLPAAPPATGITATEYALYTAIPLIVLLLLFALWTHSLTKRVRARTEELEREKAHLQESEDRFRTLLNNIPDIIWLKDTSGTFLACNKTFEQLLGASEAEIVGKTDYDFVDKESADAFIKCDQIVIENGEASHIEEWVTLANSETRCFVDTTKVPVHDSAGNPIGILGISRNITARKQAETALAETSANLKAAQHLAQIGSWTMYLTTNELQWSDEVFRIFDLEPQQASATYDLFMSKVHPEDRDFIARSYEESVQNHTPFSLIHRLLLADNSVKYVHEKCQTFYADNGSPIKSIGTVQDITQRKLLEEAHKNLESQLRQKCKMEAVGVMAGGMAHNFNNNLSIILGNIQLAKMEIPADAPGSTYLANAKIAVLRARDLIKQIMTYSRKGEQRPKELIQLTSIIEETASLLHSTIPSSINFHHSIAPDCANTSILADVSQIQEALLNLCNNATYAMQEQGELTLALDLAELKQKDIPAQHSCLPGAYLHISVQDNGSGIPVELQDKIFDPFFTTKNLHEGTGMGLATVQGIMEQHKGMITFVSREGQGTIFHLYFPIVNSSQPPTTTHSANNEICHGTAKILYVDDDPLLATAFEQMLTTMGHQVTGMNDSQETLKLFRVNAEHFDLVITDQTMPGLTGMQLIHEIKKIRPEIPTILCTGYSSTIDKETVTQAGIDAFLLKPVDMPELSQTIRRVLTKKEPE